MRTQTKIRTFEPKDIVSLINTHYDDLAKEFFELQSAFLSSRYRMHRSIETASIVLSLIRSMHLEIIRQREINLDHNLSLDNCHILIGRNSP